MPESLTSPIDPFDSKFQEWTGTQGPVPASPPNPRFAGSNELALMHRRNGDDGDGDRDGGVESEAGIAVAVSRQLMNFHAYVNSRPGLDWNTCGQAAIASMADFHNRDPYGLPRVGQYWDDGEAIDAVVNGGFGPDAIFGWGSTGGRIRDALTSYGLTASVGYSGLASSDWQNQWASLNSYVSQQLPVPVLIDVGALGGSWWTAHWPIVYRIDGGRVYLGNPIGLSIVDEATFLSAWHCWFLPYGFNHCGVYCY